MLHKTDWSSLKQIRTDNNLTFYYVQDGVQYSVITGDRDQVYSTVIREAADITDFETNFKSGATVVLSIDDATSKICLNQQYNKEIIDAVLVQYRPKFHLDKTETTVNDTDTTLATVTANAKLDGIIGNFNTSEIEFVLILDGTEIFRESLKDLDDTLKFNLGQGHIQFFPIKVTASGKTIFFSWATPPDFTTDLIIKAKYTGAATGKMKGLCVTYREKV
jgi:hypothetical protein